MPVKWQSLTLFLSLSWFITSGQVRFDHFTTDQGLSQNTILSIIQDRTGYLWIGTEDGLNRFDGYTFKKYHTVLGDSLNLPDDQIWSLLEDSQGRIWIGHSRGISYFDFLDHKFHTVLLEDNMIVSTSFQDTNGNLWFGTSGSGLIRVDKNNFKITRFRNPESPLAPYDQQAWSLVSNYIISISENSAGLLIGTRGAGLFQFQNEKFFRPDFQEAYENFFMQNDVWSIIKNTRGEFCFGTTKGLGVFQDDLRSGKLYQANDKSNSPASNRIARLCLDSRSGLWVATYGDGLKYFDFNSEKFTHFRKTVEPHSLSNNLVFTFLMDREKNVWIGTWTGGLNKLNRSARYISSYSTSSGLGDNYVPSISARGDSVFVATYSSGIYLMIENDTNKSVFIPIKDKDTLQPNYIRSIFAGSKLWVGWRRCSLYRL